MIRTLTTSFLFSVLMILILLPTESVWGGATTLDQILSHIDRVGTNLKSMRADIVQKKWTDILAEFDEGERGKFFFDRENGKLSLRKEITRPTVNTLIIKQGQVTFYQPSIKQVQRYRLGKHGDKAEFLLLGFGSRRTSLRETYDIKLLGDELLDDRTAYKLELKPKSDQVAAFFVSIVLWIDSELWVPIQQQLVEPTQDYLLIRFDNIELNPKLPGSAFEIKLPKDVKVIQN